MCHAAHQDEDEGAGVDSELDESESEAEVRAEDLKMTPPLYSYVTTADIAPPVIRGCQKARTKFNDEVGHCFKIIELFFYVKSLNRLV